MYPVIQLADYPNYKGRVHKLHVIIFIYLKETAKGVLHHWHAVQ